MIDAERIKLTQKYKNYTTQNGNANNQVANKGS
jgi:hypothetical protein